MLKADQLTLYRFGKEYGLRKLLLEIADICEQTAIARRSHFLTADEVPLWETAASDLRTLVAKINLLDSEMPKRKQEGQAG